MGAAPLAAAMVLGSPLGILAGGFVGQASGDSVPTAVGSGIGGLISSTAIGAFAYWRMRRQDNELDVERQANRDINRLLLEQMVPALERSNHSANETRAGLTAVLDFVRRLDERDRRGRY